MRWQGRRTSTNVEDRRGRTMTRGVPLGCGGLLVVLAIAWLTGTNPLALLGMLDGTEVSTQAPAPGTPAGETGAPSDELGRFASVVHAATEDTWHAVFADLGRDYREPTLVLFTDAVRSACGFNSAAVGPFYCPPDQRVYIDLGFFDQLERRFGAPGDFAQAYVIAHEVGHHVQNLLGISDEVQAARARGSASEANALSVRMELQADCLAGVWGYHAHRDRGLIEPGDFEEGLAAASAIGDDTLQRRASGTIQPESWTHGSSEQRARWLRAGLGSGDPASCDTFAAGAV
jgi:predicted metalloprotease